MRRRGKVVIFCGGRQCACVVGKKRGKCVRSRVKGGRDVVGYQGDWTRIMGQRRESRAGLERDIRKNIFMKFDISSSKDLFG